MEHRAQNWKNTVACALLGELHFIENTTGMKVALHYLRDKGKNEVDFLPVVDNKPSMMIEVKSSDDNLSPSLFPFHNLLKDAKPDQIAHHLKQNKSKGHVSMLPVHEFLRELQIFYSCLDTITGFKNIVKSEE